MRTPTVGVIIEPGAHSFSRKRLVDLARMIGHSAGHKWENRKNGTHVLAQGENHSDIVGGVLFSFFSHEDLNRSIIVCERKPFDPEHLVAGKKNILIVGGVEFCQAAVHYVALSFDEELRSPMVRFIRMMTRSRLGDILWMTAFDHDEPPVFGGSNLATIEAQLQLAD